MLQNILTLFIPAVSVLALPTRRQQASGSGGHSIAVYSASDQCLTVQSSLSDGSPVTTVDCYINQKNYNSGSLAPSVYNTWEISPGSGLVRVLNSTFCLDAGANPHNNAPVTIATCNANLTEQTWYLTDDKRIAITGGDQCLDQSSTGPQTYKCTTGNTNQIWLVQDPIAYGPNATSTAPAPAVTSAAASVGTIPFPPSAPGGTQLHPNGTANLCLTVASPVGAGSAVNINPCFAPRLNATSSFLNDTASVDQSLASYANNQLWDIARGDGKVVLHNTNFCLDFGADPLNGTPSKIWDCLSVPQQRLYYTDDNRIAITGGNQCLDVRKDSEPAPGVPYGELKIVQSWQCTTGNDQQVWTSP